jgi:hypothetical protein
LWKKDYNDVFSLCHLQSDEPRPGGKIVGILLRPSEEISISRMLLGVARVTLVNQLPLIAILYVVCDVVIFMLGHLLLFFILGTMCHFEKMYNLDNVIHTHTHISWHIFMNVILFFLLCG